MDEQIIERDEWKLPRVASKEQKPRPNRIIFSENLDYSKDTGPGGVGVHDEMATTAIHEPLHTAGMTAGSCHYITQSVLWSVVFKLSTWSPWPCLPWLLLARPWALPLNHGGAEQQHTVGGISGPGFMGLVVDSHFGYESS